MCHIFTYQHIVSDIAKITIQSRNFAYVEFADKDSVQTALALDDSLFKGRQIKVIEKRTNRPGVSTTDRPPRGTLRGFGRGRFPRGVAFMPYVSAPYRGRIARPFFRGRGRSSYFYSPY
ncbi:unnamed protein product [Rotaria sp. Silwood1]|nr:unnamed protein product [Rotaria sp. Silwood1]